MFSSRPLPLLLHSDPLCLWFNFYSFAYNIVFHPLSPVKQLAKSPGHVVVSSSSSQDTKPWEEEKEDEPRGRRRSLKKKKKKGREAGPRRQLMTLVVIRSLDGEVV